MPEPPKRPPQPSPLSDPKGPPSATGKKKPATPDGKRPGSAKRSKTRDLIVHEDRPLLPDGLPDGAEFLGYHDFTVQDLKVEGHNTRYRRGRYRLPDGTIVTALLPTEVYIDLVLISDDAGQFKLLAFLHALCWVHLERHVARLIPLVDAQRAAHDTVRDAIWNYYQRLKAYREAPTPQRRGRLDNDFDRLCLKETGWPELDEELRKIHGKKSELLVVLEHPEIPLHNNLSENDIRQYVKKRKISAGTRSDVGRRCRDTFLSVKTTCRKLGVTFWRYLRDRLRRLNEVPPLADLIRRKAAEPAPS